MLSVGEELFSPHGGMGEDVIVHILPLRVAVSCLVLLEPKLLPSWVSAILNLGLSFSEIMKIKF